MKQFELQTNRNIHTQMRNTKTYQGNPCKKCGSTEKYICDYKCINCKREYTRQWAKTPRGKEAHRRYMQSEKGKLSQKISGNLETVKATKKRWRQSEHGKKVQRYAHVRRTYGLLPEQYEAMLKDQNEKCAICFIKLDQPYVDHDHQTEKVRGLICFKCNRL